MSSNRLLRLLLLVLPVSLLLIACGNRATPAPTDTPVPPTATTAPQADPTATPAPAGDATATTDPPASAGETRTFTIVPEQSEAQYSVEEEIFGQTVGFIDTVGRTNAIEGDFQLEINGSQVTLLDNHFIVDLRTLKSNDSRRDSRIRRQWLESDKYPWAEFRATGIENWPADAAEGQDITFTLVGDLTVREIAKPITFEMTAKLEGNTLTGTGTASIMMADYGFEPPNILGMLRVRDGVTVTVTFTAQS